MTNKEHNSPLTVSPEFQRLHATVLAPPKSEPPTLTKIIFADSVLFAGCVFVGMGMVFSSKYDTNNDGWKLLLAGWGLIVAAVLLLGYQVQLCLRHRFQFLAQGEQSLAAWRDIFEQDLRCFRLVRINPVLILPFLASFVTILGLLTIEMFQHPFQYWLGLEDSYLGWIIYLYSCSFIGFFIFELGFVVLAETVQRLYLTKRGGFFHEVCRGIFFALPFIAVLAALWVALMLVRDDDDKNVSSSLAAAFASIRSAIHQLSLYVFFLVVKYFVYVNLSVVALQDTGFYVSAKEAKRFMAQNRKALLNIWTRAGAAFALLLFLSFGFHGWNQEFRVLSEVGFGKIVTLLYGGFLFTGLFSEQLSILLHYIEVKHMPSPAV